jgi:hypothetical protein
MSKLPELFGYESSDIPFADICYGPTGPTETPDHLDDHQILDAMSSYYTQYGNNIERLQWLNDQIQPLLSEYIIHHRISEYGITLSVGNIKIYIRNIAGRWGCHFKHIILNSEPFINVGAQVHIQNGARAGTTILMNEANILDVLTLLSVINDFMVDIKEPGVE